MKEKKTKETKEVIAGASQVPPAETKEDLVNKKCAEELEKVFKKYNRALQPFLAINEYGVAPRVRLAIVEDEEK